MGEGRKGSFGIIAAMAHRHRGFTLVEIVVVIVIMAILIAMAAALTRGVVAGQKRSLTATEWATCAGSATGCGLPARAHCQYLSK